MKKIDARCFPAWVYICASQPIKFFTEEPGIDFRAGLLPEEKITVVRTAQSEGKRVAMVGDSINDALALAQSDVGIAMGATGSDIEIEAAHIALL